MRVSFFTFAAFPEVVAVAAAAAGAKGVSSTPMTTYCLVVWNDWYIKEGTCSCNYPQFKSD